MAGPLFFRDPGSTWHDTVQPETVPTAPQPRNVLAQALAVPPMWRDAPITPEPVQSWPLMTRVRLGLARWISGL